MQSNLSTGVKNQNFGMALHMPKSLKGKVKANRLSQELENAIPELKNLAQKADVYVRPLAGSVEEYDGFKVLVTKPAKNFIGRLYNLCKNRNSWKQVKVADEWYEAPKTLAQLVVEKATALTGNLK